MVLMDQHAAHERVLFEQVLARLEQGNAPSQRMLLPETVEVSVRDAQFLRDLLPTLARLGVGLSEFGDRTFLLDALPPFVRSPTRAGSCSISWMSSKPRGRRSAPCASAKAQWPRPSVAMLSRLTIRWPSRNWRTSSRICGVAPCRTPARTAAPLSSR